MLTEGLCRTGPQLTRDKFITAMESIRDYDVGGLTVSNSPIDHGGSKYVDITVIGRDREIVRWAMVKPRTAPAA